MYYIEIAGRINHIANMMLIGASLVRVSAREAIILNHGETHQRCTLGSLEGIDALSLLALRGRRETC